MKHRGLLFLAWLGAVIGTGVSVYWSNVIGWNPCDLCWFQRICMYPLIVILGMGLLRKERDPSVYALPLLGFGILFSAYNYAIQISKPIATTAFCSLSNPCTVPEFRYFGWITPPLCALAGFLVLTILLYLFHKKNKAA